MDKRRIQERRISPAVTEFMANQDRERLINAQEEILRLRALNAELVAALQAALPILVSLDSQIEDGDEPIPEIAQARAALASVVGFKERSVAIQKVSDGE